MITFIQDDVNTLFNLLYKLEAHFEARAMDARSAEIGQIINKINALGVKESKNV